MRGYFGFVARNRRFLGFGALVAGASSFGQTWFISLFSVPIRADLGLTHGEFGGIYSAATLTSGFLMLWAGRLIDRMDLRAYTALAFATLGLACLGMSLVDGVVMLGVLLFGLRLSGQGVLSHIASTAMARHFDADRGKAISLAAMGYPIAESMLPTLVVAVTVMVGWRGSWGASVALVVLVLLPCALLLVGRPGTRIAARGVPRSAGVGIALPARDWTRAEVLRDPRFYLIQPLLFAGPFISTGIMFHQVHLAESKGWALTWLAACYLGYAAGKVVGTLLGGPLVDRFGAIRMLPTYSPVFGLAVVALVLSDHAIVALVYLTLAGVSTGLAGPITGAYWAERYGVAHLGSIKAMAAAIMVLGSALSPGVFGWLLDRGVTMETLAALSAGYIVAAVSLAVFTVKPVPRQEDET